MGAWIETLLNSDISTVSLVAPRVGAWIETIDEVAVFFLLMSHPAWVRGLKRQLQEAGLNPARRTPRGCVD